MGAMILDTAVDERQSSTVVKGQKKERARDLTSKQWVVTDGV